MERHPGRRVELLNAGPAGDDEGQKVHNLRTVVERLLAEDDDSEVWAFADSDAVPGPLWLRRLVGDLADTVYGATTGYRWLIPVRDADGRSAMASCVASVLNGSAAGFLAKDKYAHAWGGSMAIRASVAKEGGLVDAWRGALSDDYMLDRVVKRMGLRVRFVSACLVATPVAFDWKGLWAFAVRQYVITRVYAPSVFWRTFWLPWLYVVGLSTAVIGAAMGQVLAMVALGLVLVADQVRASLRSRAVRNALGDEGLVGTAGARRIDRWATPAWMLFNGLLLIRALFQRSFTWRGIRYRLAGPEQGVTSVDFVHDITTQTDLSLLRMAMICRRT